LRSTIHADPGSAGLTDQDRDNYVLLLTDGDANSDYNDAVPACSTVCDSDPCDSGSATNACCECRVNNALDGLVSLTQPISSFIVGFGAGIAHPEYVNCFAVHGGASRCATPVECQAISDQSICTDTHACSWLGSCDGGRDSANCHETSVECYYKADDAQALSDAFADIAGQIASCTYSLDQTPPEPDRLFVYFYYGCADITEAGRCTSAPGCGWESGECVGDPMWLERDPSHIDHWDYNPQNNQILFFGSACQEVKDGLVTPVVIMGCCEGGEC
jgi:hypothetical protein